MSGGGLGSTLGALAGSALAPATGGASLFIPALAGAAGGALGAGLTGEDVGRSALAGGIGGAIPGIADVSGVKDALTSGLGAAGANSAIKGVGGALSGAISTGKAQDALLGGVLAGLGGYASTPGTAIGSEDASKIGGIGGPQIGSDAFSSDLAKGVGADTGLDFAYDKPAVPGATSAGSSSPLSLLGQVGQYAAKNPTQAALLGQAAMAAFSPQPGVDVGQNQRDVLNANPTFNQDLPKYTMQNTATPYSGDWYKYGFTPKTAMYNAMPVKAAHGGLIGYSHGGQVQGYAKGGNVQQAANPLELKELHDIGVAIGSQLRNNKRTPHGRVAGQGTGQSDSVPAKLSVDEYVVPAEVVSQLGDGSSKAGGQALDKMVDNVRKHKTSKGSKFPPKAKNPLSYISKKAGV